MMSKKLASGILLALGCASAVRAEQEAEFYAGLGIGEVTLEDSFADVTFEGSDTGFKLFGGYKFNRYFSAEIAYIDAGNPDDTEFGITIDADAKAFQASAIGTIPLNERFGLYLRGSAFSWDSENTATDGFNVVTAETDGTDFGYGVGAIFSIASNFSIRGEFEGADFDGTDVKMLSLSGVFSF